MKYEEVLELAKARRSTKRFKDEVVSEEDIEKKLEVARWAPSGLNTLYESTLCRELGMILKFPFIPLFHLKTLSEEYK